MSRRANPTETRTEQNRATLKSLVKLEANKTCADCKRNKHPRWASWNLGIFICIRCSGIHRGMGTHISRVKSVDLDSWTDEQLQSMLQWGNGRANKYWEAKLAEGHVPSESKIENFIRTKYDSKRWVMDGPMPDPSTLDAGADDDMPLTVVQEKVKLERSASLKQAAGSSRSAQRAAPPIDLFGDDTSAPARPSTGPPIRSQPPPKAEAAPARQTKPADSLLGLDFFGGSAAAPPARPSSDMGMPAASTGSSRPDLKQSILSLYASAPKPAPQPQAQASGGFGGFHSPPLQSAQQNQSSAFGGMNDAFSSLSFRSPAAQQQSKPDPFAASNFTSPKATPAPTQTTSIAPGGSFFDPLPKSQPVSKPPPSNSNINSGGFGDMFSSPPPPVTAAQYKPAASASSDLFDFSSPAAAPKASSSAFGMPTATPASNISSNLSSAFNLSARTQPTPAAQPAIKQASPGLSNAGSGFDGWGSSDVWSTPEPSSATTIAPKPAAASQNMWGSAGTSTKPAVTAIAGDEDFGGWSTAPPAAAPSTAPKKPAAGGGFSGGDDLFSNVWQ